jgi:hypothetical protein
MPITDEILAGNPYRKIRGRVTPISFVTVAITMRRMQTPTASPSFMRPN